MNSRKINLHNIAQDYIKNIIQSVKGMKGIIMDKETQVIISLETSKTFAINEEIFMFDNIEKINADQKFSVNGIFILRPTELNLTMLTKILQNYCFKEIYLNFTNFVSEDFLKKLALIDELQQIKGVQEFYLDYNIINSNLFHLGIDSSINLRNKNWDKYENYLFNRICDGIISVCLSNRLTPVIKTIKNGDEICSSIAMKVTEFFANNMDFLRRECGRDYNGLLVIYDRREDPITPLLNQWTYQAMIHELIGINNNILEIKHGNNNKSEKLVLSDYEDKFFATNYHNDFGEVANNIKVLIDELNNEQKLFDKKTETIEDLKKMIDLLPEKKKQSAEVTKHTNIIYELTDLMHKKNLLEISSLEQDIACNNNKKEQFSKIINILKDHLYSNLDKAKLCLLYAFRYEGDPSVKQLVNIMDNNNLKEYVSFIDYLTEFAGSEKRKLDVLSNKDLLSKSKSIFFQAFKNIPNVYTQHMSYLVNVLGRIIKGDDKEFETYYPLQRERDNYPPLNKLNITKIIVFCFGGTTYEEARDCNNQVFRMANSNENIPIIIGGTCIHNSKTFLAEIAQLKFQKEDKNEYNLLIKN